MRFSGIHSQLLDSRNVHVSSFQSQNYVRLYCLVHPVTALSIASTREPDVSDQYMSSPPETPMAKRSDWSCDIHSFTTHAFLNSRKRSSSLHSVNSNAAHDFSNSITPKRLKKAEPGSPEFDVLSPVTIAYVAYLPLSLRVVRKS